MKLHLIILSFFIFSLSGFGQRIGVGDDLGSHATKTKRMISYFTDTFDLIEKYQYQIYMGSDFENDSIVVTSNAYGNPFNNISKVAKKDIYTLHVFSAVNTQNQLNYHNYSDNVLTVLSAKNITICNSVNHPKIDLIIPSFQYSNYCATSWASGVATGMIYNIIDTFISVNNRFPFSYETKALLLNTRTANKFIDTLAAKQNVSNTHCDSLIYNQSKQFNHHNSQQEFTL